MRAFLNSLICASAVALSAPAALAQETTPTEAPTPAETPAAENPLASDPTISMGTEVKSDVGQPYARETHGDWEMRCIRAPEGQKEPCQLYQLIKDPTGNPVSEINVFFIASEQGQAAGATVVTPLETLLSPQLRFAIDGGSQKRYPFAFCTPNSCMSRLGFSPEDINALKRGVKATITIVPLQAPDTEVALDVSLSGFTAGFDALIKDVTGQ